MFFLEDLEDWFIVFGIVQTMAIMISISCHIIYSISYHIDPYCTISVWIHAVLSLNLIIYCFFLSVVFVVVGWYVLLLGLSVFTCFYQRFPDFLSHRGLSGENRAA